MLPDRFDADGRPLDGRRGYGSNRGMSGGYRSFAFHKSFGGSGSGSGRSRGSGNGTGTGDGQQEMVERFVTGVGDVVEGRKTWKDLLRGVLEGGDDGGGGNSSTEDLRRGRGSSRRRR